MIELLSFHSSGICNATDVAYGFRRGRKSLQLRAESVDLIVVTQHELYALSVFADVALGLVDQLVDLVVDLFLVHGRGALWRQIWEDSSASGE